MSHRFAIVVLALAACEDGGGTASAAKTSESGTLRGSAGGFSATMSAELAKAGIGEPTITPQPGTGAAAPQPAGAGATTGTGAPPSTGSVASAGTGAGGAPGSVASAGTGAGAPGTGAAPPAAAAAPPAGAVAPAATGAATPAAAATSAAADTSPVAGAKQPSVSSAKAVGAVQAPASRAYVKPSGDVAAIKFDLEPNWERDMGEAGTFSLVVKIPGTEDTRLFSVRYGYEDQNAPVECDQYRKFLEDKGLMKVTLNRQRGAACYIEGADQGNVIAFRFLLTYGGKRLMCHGSLYKDAASAALGDLRDKVLLQAKKICETLAL